MKIASWHKLFFIAVTFLALGALTAHAQFRYDDRPVPGQRPGQIPSNQYDLYDPYRPYDPYDSYNSYDPYPTSREEVIEARVYQSIGRGQRLRLSQFLYARDPRAEVISLRIEARSYGYRSALLEVQSRGRLMETLSVGQYTSIVSTRSLNLGSLDELELSSFDDIAIDSITAVVRRAHGPQGPHGPHRPQYYPVAAYSMVTLQIHQDFYRGGELPLEQLVRQELGQTLQGAEIQRVVVEGDPLGRGQASVGVELNNRLVSPMRPLTLSQRMTPIQVSSVENVRSLKLVINGPARIMQVSIRVGRVRH